MEKELISRYEKELEKELEKHFGNEILIGGYLINLREKYIAEKTVTKEFYPYVEEKFGLKKSMVCNYIKVANKFGEIRREDGIEKRVIMERYKKFGITKLNILVGFEDIENLEAHGITPKLFVREIKEIVESISMKKAHDRTGADNTQEKDKIIEEKGAEKVDSVCAPLVSNRLETDGGKIGEFVGENLEELVMKVKKSDISKNVVSGKKIRYKISYEII